MLKFSCLTPIFVLTSLSFMLMQKKEYNYFLSGATSFSISMILTHIFFKRLHL